MKEYRVKYWQEDEDGRVGYMDFETREGAQNFYDSLGGRAEIQKYIEGSHRYETIVSPDFEAREG